MDSFHKLSRVRNSEPIAASTGTIMDSCHKLSGVRNSEPILCTPVGSILDSFYKLSGMRNSEPVSVLYFFTPNVKRTAPFN